MSSLLRAVLVCSTLAFAFPAGAAGMGASFGLGKYTSLELAKKRAGKEFRGMLRVQPTLRKIHQRQLVLLSGTLLKHGFSWGAAAGGLVGASIDGDWRKAVGGALLGGAAGVRLLLDTELRRARTETVRLGVDAGVVSQAQAQRLEAAELINADWAKLR